MFSPSLSLLLVFSLVCEELFFSEQAKKGRVCARSLSLPFFPSLVCVICICWYMPDYKYYFQDDPDPHLFAQEVRNCAGASVSFGVWSAKVKREERTSSPQASIPSPMTSWTDLRIFCPKLILFVNF